MFSLSTIVWKLVGKLESYNVELKCKEIIYFDPQIYISMKNNDQITDPSFNLNKVCIYMYIYGSCNIDS